MASWRRAYLLAFFFFFSSRRRHTRLQGDWSSDVCSSDLARTAIVALVLYALLPIVRNTYEGVAGVDPAVREAGRGMGMTDWQLLTQVELPLGFGVILAGVRVATVVSVGTATIAAAIGAGGLGVYIFRGVAVVDDTLILAGALPAALMALAADGLLGVAERRFAWRGR